MQSNANNIRLINAFPTLEFDTNTTVGGGQDLFFVHPRVAEDSVSRPEV